jgi:hypothetical protein
LTVWRYARLYQSKSIPGEDHERHREDFVKTTVVGGLLFLLPVVLILFFLGYALGLMTTAFQWFSTSLQLGRLGTAGVVTLALLVLVLVSFAAGIVATTEAGGRFTVWLENTLLGAVPQYQLLKGHGAGPGAHRERKQRQAGTSQHRRWLADRLPAGTTRKTVG